MCSLRSEGVRGSLTTGVRSATGSTALFCLAILAHPGILFYTVSAQPHCSMDAATAACADVKPVYRVINDGIYLGIDCVTAELVGNSSHFGVNALIEWGQACWNIPLSEQGRERPPCDFATYVDVITCTTNSNATVTLADWVEVGEHSKDNVLHGCFEEHLAVRENFFKCVSVSFVDICKSGGIDPLIFDKVARPDCRAQEVRDTLAYGSIAWLDDWIESCAMESGQRRLP
jgi:hypothetical protein